jgi:GT2 family glycosyltransferase/tetratricopeptide (TPR) repeat protein
MRCAPHIYELIQKCTAVTVSTEELKKHFSSYSDTIHILPNLIDTNLWSKTSPSSYGQVVIGYAGTTTHIADLKLLEEVLERIVLRYGKKVAFSFMGCATERISRLPGFAFIQFEYTFEAYARTLQEIPIDIMLVPLEDNSFNRCKSNIKWLEYSACGIAGVYADLPPYNSCVKNDETGILVSGSDPDAWFAAIDELINNPVKRRAIAEHARTEVLTRYNLSTGAEIFLKTYRQIISDYQSHIENGPEQCIKVSVIILTWNRSRMLDACLQSLFNNLYYTDSHQIIIGNSGSTDDTDVVVEKYPIDNYIKVDQNIGLELYKELFEQAKGEIIIVIDDDVIELPRHFDKEFEKYFEEFPDYGYLGLNVVQNEMTNGAKPDDSFYRDDRRGERIVQEGPVVGCCAAIKRKTFIELDGFKGYHLSMKLVEDGVLCHKIKKLGLRTGIIKGVRCFHASGPAYSQQFGYLERDIRKYEEQEMTDFVKSYRTLQETSLSASPQVSIIIPLFNKMDYTRHCLEALTLNTDESLNFEVILVDNASTDGTADYLLTLSGDITTITNKKNFGFAKAINQAAKLATGRYLVFLNNDTIPHPEWLPALIRGVERDNADIVGAKLVYPNGRIQHAGVTFDEESIGYHIYRKLPADLPAANKKRFMQCVTAACMLVKREIFTELNGFDEAYVNGFEDVDFCLRAGERGRIILYTPESVLIHFEETSEGRKDHDDKNMRRYLARWEGKVRCDDNDFYRIDGYRKEVIGNGRMRLHQLTPSPIPSYHSDDVVPTMINNAKVSLPDSEKATTLKGEGKFDKALDIFSRRLHRGDKSVLLEMGDCLASLGRFNEALAHYDGAHNFNPSDARAQVGIGVVNLLNGNYAEAAAAFSRALRASPTNSKALCGLGMARFGQGKHQEACELYKQSLENNPENATALHELIKSSYALDKYDDAVHYTQCYLMYHPLETDFLFSLAGLFYKQGGFRNVVDTLERLLIVSPEYNGASELLAKAHNELATSRVDRQPEAIAPDAAPQNYSGAEHKTKGLQQKEQGLFAEAIQSLTIVRDSGDLSVLAEIGDCLANLGNTDEALTMYQEALDRNSEDARALVGLGVINLLQEKLNKAVMFFNKALKSDSVNNRALAGLGMVRNLQGKPKEAFSFFSKALDLDPDDLNTLNNLLKIAYESDLLAEAEPYLRKYLMYHPLNNHILYSLAGLLYRVGNYSDALDNLDRLLVFEPSYEGGQELRSLLVTALTSDDTTETLATSR